METTNNTFRQLEKSNILHKKQIIHDSVRKEISRLPVELSNFIFRHGILTGGSISSIFHKEVPKDYDIYLLNYDCIWKFRKMMTGENLKFVKDINQNYLETELNGKMVTANATTFMNNVQVITLGDAEMRKTFDFIQIGRAHV